MTILLPQLTATIEAAIGTDIHGQPIYGPRRSVGVGVVRMRLGGKITSVRADSSASRGWSEEQVADVVLLMETTVTPGLGDRVTLRGATLQVQNIHPRFDLLGNLAHWQVELVAEAS